MEFIVAFRTIVLQGFEEEFGIARYLEGRRRL